MPDFPIIDSHVHLCNPKRFTYSWMSGKPSLNRMVLPEDFRAAAGPVEIERYVFAEVVVDPPQHVDEALWVAELAEKDPRLAAIIAALPLEQGLAVEKDLERLRHVKGVTSIRRLLENEKDPAFCLQPAFLAALKLLPKYDLAFDICIFHHQLPNVIRMVQQCPDVRFVLDHIGKPGIRAGLSDPWRQHLKELAALGNVSCKISGVATEADHQSWSREQLKPYIAHAIETFGFDRVMYGGDWHVLELACPYPQWVEIVDWVVDGATAEEKRKLFRDNAIAFYRL
jgi:L-fuconolactonase